MSCCVLKMRAMDESFPLLEGIQNNQTIRETILFFCFFLGDSEDQINSDSLTSFMAYFIN